MIRISLLLLLLCACLASPASAVPTGILLRETSAGKSDLRLEMTGGEAAFLRSSRALLAGTASASGDSVVLEFPTRKTLTLTPAGDAWLDQEQRRWIPREHLLKADPSWTPLQIRLVDQLGAPLETFGFFYSIETDTGRFDPLLVRPLEVRTGVIEISAPDEARIRLTIEHPDIIRGYGSEIEIERTNAATEHVAEARRGRTVSGTVLDDATGMPLAGAMVSPLIFSPPGFTPDTERAVTTGADGRFSLRGVDWSFVVTHPDLVKMEGYLQEDQAVHVHEIRLAAGAVLRGVVSSKSGGPLAGVSVSGGSGKTSLTDAEGRFELRGLSTSSGGGWSLGFEKDGFDDFRFRSQELPENSLEIELAPLPELTGRVLLPDGSPAERYIISCGPGPSPAGYQLVTREINQEGGQFSLRPNQLPDDGAGYWIGIRVEGAAPWEGVIAAENLTDGRFQADLSRGSEITATLALPNSAAGSLQIQLKPVGRKASDRWSRNTHPGDALASRTLSIEAGEALEIAHLRPGIYQLAIRGDGVTPVKVPVTLGEGRLDLGIIALEGTGTIIGIIRQVHDPQVPWRFADGVISVEGMEDDMFDPHLKFKADASGKFEVRGVPAGEVSVSFAYNLSADIISSLARKVQVLPGGTTEVRFEGATGTWAQPLRLFFGGREVLPDFAGIRVVENVTDREPFLRFDVSPVGPEPASWIASTDWQASEDSSPLIADLSPGRWRIRVFEWLGSRGFDEGLRADSIVELGETRDPLPIELGAGVLSGKVTSLRENLHHTRVIAVGKTSGRVFLSRCDGEGNFVVRFIPKDDYQIHAHDHHAGWCDLGSHSLKRMQDVGKHRLLDGGDVVGKVPPELLVREDSIRLEATAPDGLVIQAQEIVGDGSFRFGNLRPGPWLITLADQDRELARQPVKIKAGETTSVRFP